MFTTLKAGKTYTRAYRLYVFLSIMNGRHIYRFSIMSKIKTAPMTQCNLLSPRKLIAVSLVGALVYVGGCTVAPKSAPGASVSESEAPKVDADCGADCADDEGVSRYKYYLGILSVLLIG